MNLHWILTDHKRVSGEILPPWYYWLAWRDHAYREDHFYVIPVALMMRAWVWARWHWDRWRSRSGAWDRALEGEYKRGRRDVEADVAMWAEKLTELLALLDGRKRREEALEGMNSTWICQWASTVGERGLPTPEALEAEGYERVERRPVDGTTWIMGLPPARQMTSPLDDPGALRILGDARRCVREGCACGGDPAWHRPTNTTPGSTPRWPRQGDSDG